MEPIIRGVCISCMLYYSGVTRKFPLKNMFICNEECERNNCPVWLVLNIIFKTFFLFQGLTKYMSCVPCNVLVQVWHVN